MTLRLDVDAILKERYKIVEAFGSSAGTAAYLVRDLSTQERLLLWESTAVFGLRSRPPGVREYFQQEGKHYLALRLEGQTLAFMFAIAGRLDEATAGLWLFQICEALGYWHNRESGALVCLRQGSLSLSTFCLTSSDQVMIPSYGEFGRNAEPAVEADAYRFSAPETERDDLSPRSDVYALGAMLYCLLTGQPPPDPGSLLARQARLQSPRKLCRAVSRGMEEIVLKAMQLDPQRRYPTATEMAADLEAVLGLRKAKKAKSERKPSLLVRFVTFMLAVFLVAGLFVIIYGMQGPAIEVSWLKGRATPAHTPAPPRSPTETPTPMPPPTPVPAIEIVLNQVRLDRFPLVIAYANVLDERQEPVLGLSQELFQVRQDGADVAGFVLERIDAVGDPLTLVVAIDISGSMKGEPLQKAKEAASNFVSRFDAADQVSLIKFDDRIELVLDFTPDKEAVVAAIDGLRTRGDTALYDVVARSVEQLGSRLGRRAIIVLTDGRDTASTKNSLQSSIDRANAASIPLFVVGLDSTQFTPQIMDELASQTGGEYLFAPSPDDLDGLYQKIRGQLQNQYRIEFTSPHGPDGANHVLSIGLRIGGGQEIWGEKEYRSP